MSGHAETASASVTIRVRWWLRAVRWLAPRPLSLVMRVSPEAAYWCLDRIASLASHAVVVRESESGGVA